MTDVRFFSTLVYASGHQFIPNGVGDYTLVCPLTGEQPGFVPYMWARCAVPEARCGGCGQPIGVRVESAHSER